MAGSPLGPLAHVLKLKMVYPKSVKEKLLKRGLASMLALSLGLLWPGESYQALAQDIGQAADSSVGPVPVISNGLDSGAPSLPDASAMELKASFSAPLTPSVEREGLERLSPKERLETNVRTQTPRGMNQSSLAVIPAAEHRSGNAASGFAGRETQAKNSMLGRLSSRILGNSHRLQTIRRLYDGEDASSKALSSEDASAGKISSSLRSGLKKAAAVAGVAGVSAAAAVPAYAQAIHSVSASHGGLAFLAAAWPFFARGAYWVSMALGFVMAIPELHDLIKKRSYNWRTYGVIAANLMVGLIVAPAQTAADKFLWGSECLSVSAVLAAGILLAKFLPKEKNQPSVPSHDGSWLRKWFNEVKTDRSLQITLALAPVLIAAGFGMYFGLGVFMPSFITSVSPIPLSLIRVGIQILVQGFYLSLFVPDLMTIKRGEKPNSFAPGFVLIFCLIAACFVIWGGTQAWQNPAKHIDLVLVAASNVLQFLFSFITYRALKRPDAGGKKEGPLAVNLPRRFNLAYA